MFNQTCSPYHIAVGLRIVFVRGDIIIGVGIVSMLVL